MLGERKHEINQKINLSCRLIIALTPIFMKIRGCHVLKPILQISNLNKKWSESACLSQVSIEIQTGEIVALIGRTGAGKSTLLRLIAGLENPDSGKITINGENASRILPHQRGISLIFQSHVHYPGRRLMQDWNEAESKGVVKIWDSLGLSADWILQSLALNWDVLKQKPETLSGGESRRCSILRALLQNRNFIIADEPFTGMDPLTRDQVSRFLWQFVKKTRKTMMIVVHEPVDALGMADRIIVMHQGSILQTGRPESLLFDPQHMEVTKLIHQPPLNDVTRLRNDNPDDQVSLIDFRHCTVTSQDECPSNVHHQVQLLRVRWVNGQQLAEWQSTPCGPVLWTYAPEPLLDSGFFSWIDSQRLVFASGDGTRIQQ